MALLDRADRAVQAESLLRATICVECQAVMKFYKDVEFWAKLHLIVTIAIIAFVFFLLVMKYKYGYTHL